MNKEGLIKQIAKANGVTQKEAKVCVDMVLEGIVEGMKEEGKVALGGFGVFSTEYKEEHEARNPKTGEAITVEGKNVAKFKYSSVVKEAVK